MTRSGQQLARYLYYLGRIRAVRLEYSEAKDCLQQAARKVWGPPAAEAAALCGHAERVQCAMGWCSIGMAACQLRLQHATLAD